MTEKNQKDVSPDIASLIKHNQADSQVLPSQYLNDIVDRARIFKQLEEQKESDECDPVIEVK